MKVKHKEKIVKNFLIKLPHLRDSDTKLLASVWWQEMKEMGYDMHSTNAHDTLKLVADNKLSNPSSIRRCRAKLQEVHKELRGKRYLDRKRNQTNEVATEIIHWNVK
tara:strand:- start:10163 stop:10483 length:321 start_codon:yes stop_codon:yes gene_type:complete